jgi:hypothetical protein
VVITDVRPDFTTYVAESIRTGAPGFLVDQTDAPGGGGEYDSGSHTIFANNPSLGSGGIFILEFQVTIN